MSDYKDRFEKILKICFWVQAFLGALWALQDPLPPLQDFPNHVANAYIMVKLSSSEFFRHYYYLDWFPYPYLLQDLLLEFFIWLGGVNFAAKTFVLLALIAIPAGMYFLFRNLMPEKYYLCYFALPLVWNKPLFKGNCNFLLGLALAYVCIGLIGKLVNGAWDRKTAAWVIGAAAFCYLTHFIAFCILFYSAVLIIASYTVIQKERRKALALLAFIPALALMAINMIHTTGYYSDGMTAGQILSLDNIRGKIAEIPVLMACFSWEESRLMLPYWLGLCLLIVVGLKEARSNPFPFIICGALFLLYLATPRHISVMIRPYERVLFFLLFLLPLMCLNRKHLILEKIFVFALCTVQFFRMGDYFSKACNQVTPSMKEARTLLSELPERKKLMAVWAELPILGQVGYGYCVQAYYAMDREGYVASLYTQPYTVIKHKNALPNSTYPKDLTLEMVRPYDYIFTWGRNPDVEALLAKAGFGLFKGRPGMAVFARRENSP